MKIMVGIPVYDSKLPIQLVDNLLAENTVASQMGHSILVKFLPSCCNLALGRNQIVKEFLASDFEKLVFVDADITFEPGAVVKLAQYPVDFVGGSYRLKQPNEEYAVGWLQKDELWENEHGLLEVAMLPTGFLALSRNVFKKFEEQFPNRKYRMGNNESFCFFQIPYENGVLFTEDGYFCKEYAQMGGKIFLDPRLTLTHWDYNVPYIGNIGKWLQKRMAQDAKGA